MWKAIRENPRAVTYAVLMHLVLLVLLMIGLDWTPKAIKPGVKTPIEAELVTTDQLKVIEQRKAEEAARRQAEVEKKRKAEAAAQKKAAAEQQAEAERKQQAEQAAQQKQAEAERRKQAEQAAQQQAEAERIAAEKQAAVEKKRKAEEAARKKAAAEKKRKAEEAERKAAEARQREAEAALKAQLAAEEERARAQSALAEFIPYIQERIQRNWLRPVGSPAGLSCLVKVRLIPGGDVVSVSVVRSSGDSVFDRSVESAVLKASPLPLPEDANLFKHFREINFNFDPGR
ncbi:MAG: cell envelope integrity protein TolA [Halobacteria archaeon]|nr:cell envelope integrity protein TolA [Halobacteria archaeon]